MMLDGTIENGRGIGTRRY